ncbi:V-type ATP synthase subunit D [Qingshengfaniella alkalisoli]|uniref:V-type ATP synthase subunit D n=1 Tax=Qingshengfaniella alkalisoli TaxID=2599296 RepID=A0A5B8J080_9RHOB|nr:V-type ATP synthase subunit D [Qingshengfaniella alkalisoli]QDY71193.1 V-type ATP synthase subunit D [Qingshengfaniella alkalisoli]
MPRLTLNKAQLAKEKSALAMYRRYLPSLDLKRRQLMAERKRTEERIAALRREEAERVDGIGAAIPMLADRGIDLSGLATLKFVRLGERNVAGQRVPVVEEIEVEVAPYGRLGRPHWVDLTAERLRDVLRLRVEARVAEREIELLDAALAKVTQRINLFEKVLIPRTRANIRRLGIVLGDMERSAVVNAKIGKRKREAAGP